MALVARRPCQGEFTKSLSKTRRVPSGFGTRAHSCRAACGFVRAHNEVAAYHGIVSAVVFKDRSRIAEHKLHLRIAGMFAARVLPWARRSPAVLLRSRER